MGSIISLFFFLLFCIHIEAQAGKSIFNVMKFGAKADGRSDDSQAFYSAWKKACDSNGQSEVLIPGGQYMVRPVIFDGPCKGQIDFQMEGTLVAPSDESSRYVDCWIGFRYVNGLNIYGGGSFDGQGPSSWPYKTCYRKAQYCKPLSTSIDLNQVNNSKITGITSINSKGIHMNLFLCNNISISEIKIQAPENSPNTDGIHIAYSKDIQIFNSGIATGDDCISLLPGSRTVNITNVKCGPGHGISIGSLGGTPNEDSIVGITVKYCNFTSTQNGVRIKTRNSPSYSNTVSQVIFDHIRVINVFNPIIIDQKYCPYTECKQSSSKVKITDVTFKSIYGTTRSEVAVNLQCSQTNPCEKIELRNINLIYRGASKENATSSCSNVHGNASGMQQPPSCITR